MKMRIRSLHVILLALAALAMGARQAPAQARILCAGDSITKGYGVSISYPTRLSRNTGYATINVGIGGVRASRGLRNIDGWLAAYHPSHVLIMYGTNDANSGNDLRSSADNVLQTALKVRNFGATPIIGTIPPMIGPRSANNSRARSFNGHLRSLAAAHGITVADIYSAFGSGSGLFRSDGFHPNDNGAELIARTFASKIRVRMLTLSPTSVQVADTGVIDRALTVSANEPWTATASPSWITIVSGASGSGNGTIHCDVAPNTGNARTGTVTVVASGIRRTCTIQQAATALTLQPASLCVPAAESLGRRFTIKANRAWTANANRSWITLVSGDSGWGNGTVVFNVASNDGPARSGAIIVSVGGVTRSFPINQWPVPTNPLVSAEGDIDGDLRADLAVYQPATGMWTVQLSSGSLWTFTLGSATRVPVPADYDGDGLLDFAVYRGQTGDWYILESSTGITIRQRLGGSTKIPVPGDYDGDGKTDPAVYHQNLRRWYVRGSTAGTYRASWGYKGWVPAPADFDGDGITDLAVFNPSNGMWHVHRSATGSAWQRRVGSKNTLPVPADYDGDGRADLAVFNPARGEWSVLRSSTGRIARTRLGTSRAIPVPADYDGDGAADFAVYTPASRNWQILRSTDGRKIRRTFGGKDQVSVLLWPTIHSWLGLR